jgi:hypothetical protein
MTGFEPLFAAAVAGLTGIVTEIVKEKGGKLLKQADVDLLKPELTKASRQYIQNYEQRHGNLKLVCVRMDAPVRLEEVYTAVQLLDRSEIRYFESAESLQDLFRQSGRGFEFKKSTRQDGIAVANQYQYLMVLGGPGVGKSTFLRKVGLEALKPSKNSFQHQCIPVFLRLQAFNSKEITIEQLITQEFETCGFPEPAAFTKAALEKGKLLLLLDGLDEVPTEFVDLAIRQIQDLVDRYSQNRFIASCRIAAYKGGFDRFKDLAMAAFDDTQIEQFIHNWFRAEPETAKQCWELLSQPEYRAAKELAQTPLLLTLLCVIYDESQSFPKNRAAIYGEALDVLLKKWSAEKRLKRDPIYKELSPELEQLLLSEIAYTSFAADQLFFSKREAVSQIKTFLIENLNAPKHLDGEAVLNAIEVQQGIFVERARDTYSFSHLTLQEYLTAQHIIDEHQIEQLVTEHLIDRRWREVFLLVAGLTNRADELLHRMEIDAQKYINSEQLSALLTWADQQTAGSEGKFKPVAKRIVSIYFALALNRARIRSLDYAPNPIIATTSDIARDLVCVIEPAIACAVNLIRDRVPSSNHHICDFAHAGALALDRAHAITLAQGFERIKIIKTAEFEVLIAKLEAMRAKVRSGNHGVETRQAFIQYIYQAWLDTLHLQQKLVELSEKEAKALANYFYANELMVKCKEAAVRVSANVWAGIEDRMLRVVDNA